MGLLAKFSNNNENTIIINKDLITMTNAETISKLNNALNTLIKAYEELQGENTSLETRVSELEDEVLELETVKEDLESNVTDLTSNTEEDNSNISSMLGKIEGLLNKKVNGETPVDNTEANEQKNNVEEITLDEPTEDATLSLYGSSNNTREPEEEKKESDNNKIDLNRMASLLNGFNN
jgi:chromosome segregation ATPase